MQPPAGSHLQMPLPLSVPIVLLGEGRGLGSSGKEKLTESRNAPVLGWSESERVRRGALEMLSKCAPNAIMALGPSGVQPNEK